MRGDVALVTSGPSHLVAVGATVVAAIALTGALYQRSGNKFHSSALIVGAWFLVLLLSGVGTVQGMVLGGGTLVLALMTLGTVTEPGTVSEKFFYLAGYVAVWFALLIFTVYSQ